MLFKPNSIVYQFNINHCRAAAAEVLRLASTSPNFVFALQEPYLNPVSKQVALLGNRHSIITSHEDSPRAIIYAHVNVNLWPVSHLMDRDVAVALWRKPTKIEKDVLLLSVYWDCDNNTPIPNKLIEAINYAKQRNLEIIVLMDANAKNTIWGSNDTNHRGRLLEDLITHNNLTLLNHGNTATFVRYNCATFIDVTLASSIISTEISNWFVDPDYHYSDHSNPGAWRRL